MLRRASLSLSISVNIGYLRSVRVLIHTEYKGGLFRVTKKWGLPLENAVQMALLLEIFDQRRTSKMGPAKARDFWRGGSVRTSGNRLAR